MKQQFRISLLEGSTELCNVIVIMAAKFNGGDNRYNIDTLKEVFKVKQLEYPTLYGDCVMEKIGENILHIDRKIMGNITTVCIVEMVSILQPIADL